MLEEISATRQIKGEPRRRWFTDAEMDLTVWVDDGGAVLGFQLCYDKTRWERALTWRPESGFDHHAVDDGENRPGKYKATPILVADGAFDPGALARAFEDRSGRMDPEIASFVLRTLRGAGR